MTKQTDKEKEAEAIKRVSGLLQNWGVGSKIATAIAAGIIAGLVYLLSGCSSLRRVEAHKPDGTVITVHFNSGK